MKWLEKFVDKLERLVAPIAVPNLGIVLIAGQVLCYFAAQVNPELFGQLVLIGSSVLEGEVWRPFTFVFAVFPGVSFIWMLIGWWFFHFCASMMEQTWGTARFNLYILVGYVATLVAAFVYPNIPITSQFVGGSVFLALAAHYPRFVIRVMFILPVEIRWLAYIAWAGTIYGLIAPDTIGRGIILAGVFNYLLMIGPMQIRRLRDVKRRADWKQKTAAANAAARHTCTVCGIDSNSEPDADFRYCSQCDGAWAYCEQHLRDHEHVVDRGEATKS